MNLGIPSFFLLPFLLIAGEPPHDMAPLLDTFSVDRIRHHVNVLGADVMTGRATGTPGERLAADYIRSTLEEYHVAPAITQRSYFQTIPLHGSTPQSESQLVLYADGTTINFHLGQDYVLFNTGAQTFLPQPTDMVFVGYGIVAPEFDYNDYQHVDVTGKIVVFISGEPPSDDPSYFAGTQPTIYSYAESKERIAISRGARGCLLIQNPLENQMRWENRISTFLFEDINLAYSVTSIFSALVNPMSAPILFRNSPYSFDEILAQLQQSSLSSFELKLKMSFRGVFDERHFFSRNIVATVPGTDAKLRDSYLILSAHYDHLGIGTPVKGDSIYNGVVDNAMGAAALLELARTFALFPPKRSVLFLFLSGEEKGLLGSNYYIDNPVVPLYKSIANINIDGLAIFDTFYDVIGFGAEMSTMQPILQKSAALMGLTVSPLPPNFSRVESFARSDQITFARAGIPATIVMEGVNYHFLQKNLGIKKHLEWMQNIYHSPFDDLHQPINWRAVEQHGQFLLVFAWNVANAEKAPEWLPGTPYLNARLQSIAEKR